MRQLRLDTFRHRGFCRLLSAIVVAILAMGALPQSAVAAHTVEDSEILSVSELVSSGAERHGTTVCVRGEVVGDLINGANGQVWLTITDGQSALAISASTEMATAIDSFGRYQMRGTTVQVKGDFLLACDTHDGVSDVHASELVSIAAGEPQPETLNSTLVFVGLVLTLAGSVLALVYRLLRERSR